MNILVTGSRGRIGRSVVRELAAAGHAVTATDRVSGPPAPGRFILGDCADAGDVYALVAAARADAVIHLGAWSDAGQAPDGRVFGDNVAGTFNVLQACADLGVRRRFIASLKGRHTVFLVTHTEDHMTLADHVLFLKQEQRHTIGTAQKIIPLLKEPRYA